MMIKTALCIALFVSALPGRVLGQTFDPDAGLGSSDASSEAALRSIGQGDLIPQQKELVAYFEKMMAFRQKLYNQAASGASDEQTAQLLETYLGDLKGMRVPASVRQYHDALIKIMETGSAYQTSGGAKDQAGQQAMMSEFNAILDEAGMRGAVEQQMRAMGSSELNFEAVEEDGTDNL